MICSSCKHAGALIVINCPTHLVEQEHNMCEAPTTCACQHSVDPHAVNRVAIELEQRGKIDTRIHTM